MSAADDVRAMVAAVSEERARVRAEEVAPLVALLRQWVAWLDRADDRECLAAIEEAARAALKAHEEGPR